MLLWAVEACAVSQARPEQVWKLLEDVKKWPSWDETLEWAKLEGPFQVGSQGLLKSRDSSILPFRLTFVEKNQRFGFVAKKFCTTLAYTYQINSLQDGSICITNRVIVGGLFAPFLRFTLAKKLKKSLPKAMSKLVAIAEQSQ